MQKFLATRIRASLVFAERCDRVWVHFPKRRCREVHRRVVQSGSGRAMRVICPMDYFRTAAHNLPRAVRNASVPAFTHSLAQHNLLTEDLITEQAGVPLLQAHRLSKARESTRQS